VALGIAVELSGIEGALAAVLAWVAVAAGIAFVLLSLVAGHPRATRRSCVKRIRPVPLDRRLVQVGNKIIRYKHERDADAPGSDGSSLLLKPFRVTREIRESREYEQDTLSIYRERFAPRVRGLVSDLLGSEVGQHEARLLLTPTESDDIEWIGRRLVKAGEDIQRGSRRQVA
jgi:hypothetical protein